MTSTPDTSRALGLFVHAHPERCNRVVNLGWDGIPQDWRDEATRLFIKRYGDPPMLVIPQEWHDAAARFFEKERLERLERRKRRQATPPASHSQ